MSHRRVVLILTTVSACAFSFVTVIARQGPAGAPAGADAGAAFRTPWGEPDLQGIWSGLTSTPVERPEKFAGKLVMSEAEANAFEAAARLLSGLEGDVESRHEVGGALAKMGFTVSGLEGDVGSRPGLDSRSNRGTEQDVGRAYNQHWLAPTSKARDRRTSLIVDPADGMVPPLTPEAKKRTDEVLEYRQALLQGTWNGRPGPISPRRNEPPPAYVTTNLNRADGPEDRSSTERCFGATMPNLGAVYRIVQSPGVVGIYHDSGQGQGFVRTIPIDSSPRLPSKIRLLHGDSRGRWEGQTLVIDTTNFTQKMDFRGSRENLHLVERLTRASDNRITYRVTVEDPTTWTRPWTLEVPWDLEPGKANQSYESNCHEGNYGMVGVVSNTRAAERLFKEGKGPDPATQSIGGGDAAAARVSIR